MRFVHENRNPASGLVTCAVSCAQESTTYARERQTCGKALAENQAIQWPLVELPTQMEMLRH